MAPAMALRLDRRRTAASGTSQQGAGQPRRLLTPAEICDGSTRSETARLGNMTLHIVRDGVLRFNPDGPAELIDRKAPCPTPRLTDEHRKA